MSIHEKLERLGALRAASEEGGGAERMKARRGSSGVDEM